MKKKKLTLIKKLPPETAEGGKKRYFAIYHCGYCGEDVKRGLGSDRNCKSCGCLYHIPPIDIDKAITLYEDGMSFIEIGKIFRVSGPTIGHKFKEYGYKHRTMEEGLRKATELKKRVRNISGEKYGRLLAIKFFKIAENGNAIWTCECDCGREINIESRSIITGNTKSCGCLKIESDTIKKIKHNMCDTGAYSSWANMKQRCENPKSTHSKYYKGRGITFDKKWDDFLCFYDDMGDRPKGLTLERIDNNKGYFKENCKWATREEQSNNTRQNRHITFNSKTMSVKMWSDETGLTESCMRYRMRAGWEIKRMLTTPKGKYEFKNQ